MPAVGECDINSDSVRSGVEESTLQRWQPWKVRSTVNDDRWLFIALGVQLDGRWAFNLHLLYFLFVLYLLF